ncbi:MAG: Recombinase [Hyphomicrobiales bacterium]|nr:Recombinase [Hyphomicrobiales bacterium]
MDVAAAATQSSARTATRKQKGTCDNERTITRQAIEARVLDGLKEQLLTPDLVTEFVAAFHDKVEAIRREQRGDAALRAREASEIELEISGLMRSIEHGFYDPAMKARLKDLQAERERLGVNDDDATEANMTILSHPSLHDLYRRKV